jgi:hypothetical protein
MARNPGADSPDVKSWVKTQEAILDVEDMIAMLRERLSKDPGNPALSAEDERYSKIYEKLAAETREIEKTIAADQLDELKSERDSEMQRRRLVGQRLGNK